jgi:hypothetical protein
VQFQGGIFGIPMFATIQATIFENEGAEKMKPQFYGPYKISRRVGEVAYELELPEGCKIHNHFYVSCLKKEMGHVVIYTEMPHVAVLIHTCKCEQSLAHLVCPWRHNS